MAISDGPTKDKRLAPFLETLKGPRPLTLAELRQDEKWKAIFRLHAADEFSLENWDFLNAVDRFRSDPKPALAAEIHYQYVGEDAPTMINLPDPVGKPLRELFATEAFDDAERELAQPQLKDRLDRGELTQNELDESPIDEFLTAVKHLKESERPVPLTSGGGCPWEIYHLYVGKDAIVRVPLTEPTREKLAQRFTVEPAPNQADFFDAAHRNIFDLTSSDTFVRFTQAIIAARTQMGVQRPAAEVADSTDDRIKDVTEWNEEALANLSVGKPARFYQVDQLLIIEAPGKEDDQEEYIKWAKAKKAAEGKIALTKKGGLFAAKSILAEGVRNKDDFVDAIRLASSDIRVEFPTSSKEPGAKVSAFGPKKK